MIPKLEFRSRSHQSIASLFLTFPLVLHTTLLITYFILDCDFFLFSLLYLVVSDTLQPPWTVAHQAPLSVGILQASILEWVAIPSSRHRTQGSNPGLLHYRWILYCLSHQGSPRIWSGQPVPSPGDLPDPGIKPGNLALQADSLPAELPGLKSFSPLFYFVYFLYFKIENLSII